jgi:hypothetical protein
MRNMHYDEKDENISNMVQQKENVNLQKNTMDNSTDNSNENDIEGKYSENERNAENYLEKDFKTDGLSYQNRQNLSKNTFKDVIPENMNLDESGNEDDDNQVKPRRSTRIKEQSEKKRAGIIPKFGYFMKMNGSDENFIKRDSINFQDGRKRDKLMFKDFMENYQFGGRPD